MPSNGPYESSQLVTRQKRRGVALSCAECRRLKLKCSRQFPCSNCVKKGCAAICPDGSLTTGKGNRFVLANTETLHEKITELANRVRALEDALAQSHSLNSNDVHPLLSEDLLQIKRPLERERAGQGESKGEPASTGETIDALGSLSISQSGRSTFFGTTANSWYLLQIEEGSDEEEPTGTTSPYAGPQLPKDLPWLGHGFPFTSVASESSEAVRASIFAHVPPIAAATRMRTLYFRHAAWMYNPISEKDFEVIFQSVYNAGGESQEPLSGCSLSVFFMVLAIGQLLDLDLPPHSQEAMRHYEIARAAISLESVLEEQTVTGIQALLLMCHFMFLSDMGRPRWVLMGIVVKMAQSIGLHRDSGKWKLDAEETQKRRELFYEILTYDMWQSLTFGRPPSLASAHIDSRLPHETTVSPSGEVEMSFAAWKHKFSAECMSVVQDQAFGSRTPAYSVIQELDKKVRNWYVPPSLMVPGFGNSKIGSEVEQPTIELTMQRYTAFAIREMTLFYMHRGFFAKALEDSTVDPMGSKYAPSVLAAHRSAMTFVALVESLFKQHPQLTERMWFLFTHVFSCAVVLGSIAVKARMQLAPGALNYLDLACHLFSQVSDTSRTSKILPVLVKLKERAHAALASAGPTSGDSSFFGAPQVKTEDDSESATELSVLGGMTRLVERRNTPSSPSYSGSGPSSPNLVSSAVNSPSRFAAHAPSLGPPSASSSYRASSINDNPDTWPHGNYTHIQNLNVNINVGDYPSYPSSSTSAQTPQHPHQQPEDMSYNPYAVQPHAQSHADHFQQQQHYSMHHHHSQQHAQQQMPIMDSTMNEYYGYNNYSGGQSMQMAPTPSVNEIDYPWHNLMAQYRA